MEGQNINIYISQLFSTSTTNNTLQPPQPRISKIKSVQNKISSRPAILIILSSHSAGWYLVSHSKCKITLHNVLSRIPATLAANPRSFTNTPQPEFAHPNEVLSPHADLTIASPRGATVFDPVSIELFKGDAYCMEFAQTKQKLWMETQKLETFLGKAKGFTAILYVGGFGRKFAVHDSNVHRPHVNSPYEQPCVVEKAKLCCLSLIKLIISQQCST